ncbi:hypothetical protein L3X38_005834 [Prunus dulcis]|uniref:RNase H type-1 domain-containing protein n=1 Tax=Prunus dulcis TaxID=3755 RepID=A0AAD4ZRE2_PRUDU|nr:hypothetical protein L3X38_005834 [Prunus dulcis]
MPQEENDKAEVEHLGSENKRSCKVSSDGGRKPALGYTGVGGLLRDHNGNWIKSFSVNLGVGSVIEAKLWGIFWGLHLAWEAGFRSVEKEWCCSVKHIFREQNFVADSLASMSHDLPLGLHVLDWCGFELLAADARSLAHPRMVVV